MRTYGRIASLPNSWLRMQKAYQNISDFAIALNHSGVSSDVVEWNLMTIKPEDIPPASGDASMEAGYY